MGMKLTVDPFNPSLGSQLKFFLKVNTSKKSEEDLVISDGSQKVNMKQKLYLVHSPFGGSGKPSDVALSYGKIEKSIQVINGIPILGTITSMLSSITYLILRAITEHEFHKSVSQMVPGYKKMSRDLLEVGRKHINEIQCGNVSDECLQEIAEIILRKKIRNLNSLTQQDIDRIADIYLKFNFDRPLDLKKELTNKFAHDFSDVAKRSFVTMWHTNMLARSMMGIIPFYKPWTRAVQYSIAHKS